MMSAGYGTSRGYGWLLMLDGWLLREQAQLNASPSYYQVRLIQYVLQWRNSLAGQWMNKQCRPTYLFIIFIIRYCIP